MRGNRTFRAEDFEAGEYSRDTIFFYEFDAAGDPVGYAGAVPGMRRWGELLMPTSFTLWPVVEPGHAEVYAGDGSVPEIEIWRDGSVVGRILWRVAPRPVDGQVRRELRRHRLAQADAEDFPEVNRYLADVPLVETLPVFDEIVLDDSGMLWVREYQPPWRAKERWWVFDQALAWLGSVTVPDGLEVAQVTEDRVVGVVTDELGVERVAVYELSR